jgi:hypothetical protein
MNDADCNQAAEKKTKAKYFALCSCKREAAVVSVFLARFLQRICNNFTGVVKI